MADSALLTTPLIPGNTSRFNIGTRAAFRGGIDTARNAAHRRPIETRFKSSRAIPALQVHGG